MDLGEVARSLVQELEHVGAASEHGLEADVEGEAWALGDEERVLQIGRALVMNALVHTPSGYADRRPGQATGGQGVTRGGGRGPGIPREQQEAIFERFYRGEGGVAWGSGLGLAIAQGACAAHERRASRWSRGPAARCSRSSSSQRSRRSPPPQADERFHVKTCPAPNADAIRPDYDLPVEHGRSMSDLSHVDEAGDVRMVDVGSKPVSRRRAVARASVRMAPETAARLADLPKGNALVTAQLAGIMAAKRTAELIPLCHPLPLSHVDVTLEVADAAVEIETVAETTAQTGVEMEALVAASVAALTVYDMAKAIDKDMEVTEVKLVEKTKEPVE